MYDDPHYIVDEQTGRITFDTQHRYYKLESKVFSSNGVNIDTIKTIEEYFEHTKAFRYEIQAAFHEYIRNKKAGSLENKLTKSLILGDTDEVKRLDHLINKINKAHLKVIK